MEKNSVGYNTIKIEVERVHFYSGDDLACPYEIDKILKRLRAINPLGPSDDLNNVFELWNIYQYLKRDLIPTNLNEIDKKYLDDITPKIQGIIIQCMANWSQNTLVEDYKNLTYDHQQDFWRIIVETKTYKSFPKTELMKCIKISYGYILRAVLSEKEIVKYLDKELAVFIKDSLHAVEVLFDNYAILRSRNVRKVHFPDTLSMSDREQMVLSYITNPKRNLNYLRIISSHKNDNVISISDKTRLLCKRAEKEENDNILKDGQTNCYRAEVSANFKKAYPFIELTNSGTTYNLGCLKDIDGKGFILLLKNVFGFLSQYNTIPFISLESEDSLFDIFGLRGISWYRHTPSFLIKNMYAQMQIAIIEKGLELFDNNIEFILDSVIEYINSTYDVNFNFNAPSSSDSNLTKIRHLFAEMDSMIKQYQLYVENGKIDFDLLSMSSIPLGYSQIKSIIFPQPKYVELKGASNEAKKLQYILSSNNTIFAQKGIIGYESLYTQLVRGEQPELSHRSQYFFIQKLIDRGVLDLSSDRNYKVTPIGHLMVILYNNDFAKIEMLPIELRNVLPEMEKMGWLSYSSTLFHKLEANYFNYWLNKKDFTNGYDLRNKYMHGVQSNQIQTIESDYRIAKFLFILLLMKIIDDLECK